MPRIDLEVPFNQKDAAKKRGALWDSAKRVWYVPQDTDVAAFNEWIATPEDERLYPNLRADRYFVARSECCCWACKEITPIYAFVLPAGYEARPDKPQNEDWQPSPNPTLLSYISLLPRNAKEQMESLAPEYHFDRSNTIHGSYWMNHCEYCDAKQGDFYTIETLGAPFQIDSAEKARQLYMREICEPFEARACYGDYPADSRDFFDAGLPPEDESADGFGVVQFIRSLIQAVKRWLSKLWKRLGG